MSGDGRYVLVDPGGRRIPLAGVRMLVGRGAEAQLMLDDEQTSRRHFLLTNSPQGWLIRDLKSTNGTHINGEKLSPGQTRLLTEGDRIQAGHSLWTVEQGAPSRLPAAIPGPAAIPHPPAQAAGQNERLAHSAPGGVPVWQWLASALLAMGALLIAISAFEPWLRIEVELSFQNLPGGDVLSDVISAAGQIFGVTHTPKTTSLEINGMDVHGMLLLITAGLVLVGLMADLTLRLGRSSLPAVAYLTIVTLPVVLILAELQSYRSAADRELLFGISLHDLLQGASHVLLSRLVPLAGAYLGGLGLLLVCVGGLVRFIAPVLRRTR